VGEDFWGAGILSVQVAATSKEFGRWNLPCPLGLFAVVPPRLTFSELVELNWRRRRIVLPAFWEGVFVIPDVLRWPGAVEEQDVSLDAGIRGEYPVRQADNGVQVEVLGAVPL
jgi:hypothetical protein